jgi:CubicO group peptidase (beta-lactamase class C family)
MQVNGQLNVDDDIRKYLPYMPKFDQIITIRQMLHHTSGLRSLHTMIALAGWRGDDSRTNEDLVGFMKHQKDLNFEPGAEYMYCNTGFILIAEIIEKISEAAIISISVRLPPMQLDNLRTR